MITRRIFGDGIDELVARISSGTIAWYETDRQGSVRGMLNNSATLSAQLEYDGFGNLVSGTATDRHQFTGREWDVELALQYNRARFYDPETRRWISQDPLGFDAGDSNLYRYVNNGPTDAADPSGLTIRIYYTRHQAAGYYHIALAVFDPAQRANGKGQKEAFIIEGEGPGKNNVNTIATREYDLQRMQEAKHVGQRRQFNEQKWAKDDEPLDSEYVDIDTGSMTYKEQIDLLKKVSGKLRQVATYNPLTGPNSNTYIAQLLRLASEMDSRLVVPKALSGVTGWNYLGSAGYGTGSHPMYDKWGEPILANINYWLHDPVRNGVGSAMGISLRTLDGLGEAFRQIGDSFKRIGDYVKID